MTIMCDQWMPTLLLPLTREQFYQLPRNAAYRYELLSGQVVLSPRPKHYHALLDLQPRGEDETLSMRRLQADDWDVLPKVFAASFHRIQPFGSLDDATRLEAARQCLERTRVGGDGPWI